jgi:hypothetical protein
MQSTSYGLDPPLVGPSGPSGLSTPVRWTGTRGSG